MLPSPPPPWSPALPILVLLGGCVLQLVLARALSAVGKGVLATLTAALAAIAVLGLLPATFHGAVLTAPLLAHWDGVFGLSLRVDGLSALFMLMGGFTGTCILLYSVRYMQAEPRGVSRFYALMLVFIAGLLQLTAAADMLGAYLAWELIGLCSYLLVGFWYSDKTAADGARKVLLMTHLAGYGFLAGMVTVFARAGSFDWADPRLAGAFTTGVAALLLVAAMAKSVIYPLHSWIPEAMQAPTPVSALLHSACYVKAGVYLIARMEGIGGGAWRNALGAPLTVLGCVTILVGVIFALRQTDLKRLLAFHTVSQLGYIVTGLAIGGDLGIAAGLFYCFSHALFKGTLFMCAGAVQHATGTRDLRRLGGLAARMPVTAGIWLLAAAAISGVPLTNGFIAKWLLFNAALDKGLLLVVLAGWIGSVLTAFSFLKATVNTFYGVLPSGLDARGVYEAPASMLVGMGAMGGLCLAFGLMPQVLMAWVVGPAVGALGLHQSMELSWLGLLTPRGSIGTTVSAGVLLASLLLGATTYLLARLPLRAPVSVFSGGEDLPEGDRPGAVDFAAVAEAGFHPVYSLDPDPLYVGSWRTLLRGAERARGLGCRLLEDRPALATGIGMAMMLGLVLLL